VSVIVKGKNPRKPYTVRYWADGRQRERSFVTRGEARDWKIKTDHDVRAHVFTDDKDGKEPFGLAAVRWIASRDLAPLSTARYESLLKVHVAPALGERTLASAARDRDGVTDLLNITMAGLSRTRRSAARTLILGTLDSAVASGKIGSHRCKDIELAGRDGAPRSGFVFPSHAQLEQLASGLTHPLTIWLMRGCGLRVQEALAVRREDFRDGGKTLRVHEQATRDGRGMMPLKHRQAGQHRDIPVPGYLWAMVADLPEGYLFANTSGKLPSYSSFLESFTRYARRAGIPEGFTPHSLRHAFASALLSQGVPITDLAQWLGHRDINVTYSTYGHLVPSAASRAAAALDAEYAEWSREQ
jgi:integrase